MRAPASSRCPCPGSRCRGFSLLEALIALALVSVVLLFGFALQARLFLRGNDIAVEEELLARGAAVAESLRAGVLPLRSGTVDGSLAWPGPEQAERFSFTLEVAPTDTDGVCRVSIRGRGVGRGRLHDVALETRVWVAGGPCG
jgi:prepilin-type N-terminal cleavage/methylation domain-containing protein